MTTKVLSFHFTAYNEDGSINDISAGSSTINILTGFGNVLPIIENTLKNMEIGSKQTILVAPKEGFRDIDTNKIQNFPKKVFNTNDNLESGMMVNLVTSERDRLFGIIDSINNDIITINFNHPLAGKTLKFDLNLVNIRDVSKEEIEHGHVHDENNSD